MANAADTLPPVTVSADLARRLRKYHNATWKRERDELITQAVEAGGSLREVGEMVGLSHTQVAAIVERVKEARR